MKGQTAVEYLMTYGWAILIILIVAGVLAYYGIFAPAGFLGPTARGFGQVQVLNPWSVSASNGALTLNIENRVGGTIRITQINFTVDETEYGKAITSGECTSGCISGSSNITSGTKAVIATGAITGWPATYTTGDTYSTTVTIFYEYQGGGFSSTGTISGTYS